MPSHNHYHSSEPKSSSKTTRSSASKKNSTPATSHTKDNRPVNVSNNSSTHHQYAENSASHTSSHSTNSYVNSNGNTSSDPSVKQWLAEYSESAASRNYQYGVSYQGRQFQQTDGALSLEEFGPPPQDEPWFMAYGDAVQEPEGNFAGIGSQFES